MGLDLIIHLIIVYFLAHTQIRYDFRFQIYKYIKVIPYTRDEEIITGMKIISMDTDSLKKIIGNKVKYKYLYEVFDKYHEIPLETIDWHDGMIKEVTVEYRS